MIKIGIIGCGLIAHAHMAAYSALACEVVACCDSDETVGRAFAKKYNVTYFRHYQDLLASELTAVSICTPHFLHGEMTLAALAAEKSVLCEKPMALLPAEAEAVCQAVAASDQHYAVCFQNRFNETTLYLKQLLSEERWGRLRGVKCQVTWHRTAEYYRHSTWRGRWQSEGGGVLINQAIHSLDLIAWLIAPPQKIRGQIMTSLLAETIEVEDSAMATALLPEGIPLTIYATNTYSADPSPEITFDFEKGAIRLTNETIWQDEQVLFKKAMQLANRDRSYWGDGHIKLIAAFLEQVSGKQTAEVQCLAGIDACQATKIVSGIYASSSSQEWIDL